MTSQNLTNQSAIKNTLQILITNMKRLLYISPVLLLAANLHGAVLTSVNFGTAPVFPTNAGNVGIELNEATDPDTYLPTTNGTFNINQWVSAPPAFDGRILYDAGADTYYSDSELNNLRGTILIMDDFNATTGNVTVGLDFTIASGDKITLELYGWDTGETSPILSWGGPGGGTSWNVTTIGGDAVTLLNEVYTTGTSASEAVNLGTGYDFYTWRVGFSGLNGDAAGGGLGAAGTTFSNISVIPEPSGAILAGAGSVLLLLRRRRS